MVRVNGVLRLGAAALAAVCAAGIADAASLKLLPLPVGTTERQLSDVLSGFGLGGWDPVSYFLDEAPRPGVAAHEAILAGVAWRFASAANRAAFLRDPEAFLPRLGGYDMAAAADGRLARADPAIYAIRDARLYLFRHDRDRDRFLGGADAFAEAEAGWTVLRLKLAAR